MTKTKQSVVAIPGDGIGPEVWEATRRVIDASGAKFVWIECQAGQAALDAHGELLPHETISLIQQHRVAIKGPCTTPIGGGFRSVNVHLRKEFNLYAAVRPVRSQPGVITRYEDVDLVVLRENTEGLYSGAENQVTEDVIVSMKVATKKACLRIARFAFRYATRNQRKKISCLHKANIMKMTDGLFLDCARRVHEEEYPNIAYEELIIDAAAMRIVQDPTAFDIILCENFYGDVISDLCAGLVGGLGVTPGANIGDEAAIFEAVHGSAPDIAGQNKANPLALMMSGVQMLRYLATNRRLPYLGKCADSIALAYRACLAEGATTADLGGKLSTTEFTDAVIEHIEVP
jgi:isocitrate dehydrogenase (NAD+)